MKYLVTCKLAFYILLLTVNAYGSEINVNRLADAIHKAEGINSHFQYGILTHYRHTTPRQACINTIRHALRDYARIRPKEPFIAFLGARYCPTRGKALTVLEQRLNGYWIANVGVLYDKG